LRAAVGTSAWVVLGSANLTSAGYRRQVELALSIDLDELLVALP
jgi:hypothetical protein